MASQLSWPSPKPLEGVKSRKRHVFKVESAKLQVGKGQVVVASDLSLTLASRVAALGEAGSAAVTDWLLGAAVANAESEGQEPPSGMLRHEGLNVVCFGPGRPGSSCAVAMAALLADERPQVVVLDEAREAGDAAWKQTYEEVLQSEALRAYRGAVVVCAAEETRHLAQVCSECWTLAEGVLSQEPCLEVILDALEEVDASSEALMKKALEIESCHLAYWIDRSRDEGWQVTLFGKGGPDGNQELAGFLCHHMIKQLAEFKVEFVFVPDWLRGGGYGKRLVRWVIDRAAHMPKSACSWISLSAVDERVSFYEQFGFVDLDSSESKSEDQTWMELENRSLVPEDE